MPNLRTELDKLTQPDVPKANFKLFIEPDADKLTGDQQELRCAYYEAGFVRALLLLELAMQDADHGEE